MPLFESLVVVHVIVGTVGLLAFWVPIVARKGARPHRRWGRVACYGFIGAGTLAIAMALLSLFGPEVRIPEMTDRDAFNGLLGWMMLFLGLLTIGFADYGIAVVKHKREHARLRAPRYQIVIASVVISALWCAWFGFQIGEATMIMVAAFGLAAMTTQQLFIWRRTVPPRAYIEQHFRALLGMGICAYTAFLSVGLIRLVPELVFNPIVWAGPSVIGVGLILYYTFIERRKKQKVAAA
ncbi:MAG: hypothetical protein AAF411_24445 [Myxococcota bacterium]